MSKEQLQEVVTALPSYDDWQAAIASLERAVTHRAETRNGTEVETLKGQLAVAEAKEAIVSPTNQLKIEIIEECASLPLAYQLGMLSAIDRPHQPRKARGINLDLITGPPLHQNEDIQISEFEWPSSNVFEQAARIGNVIMAVSASLHSKRPTPIAKLHLGRRRTNLTFPTVAEYVIASQTAILLTLL